MRSPLQSARLVKTRKKRSRYCSCLGPADELVDSEFLITGDRSRLPIWILPGAACCKRLPRWQFRPASLRKVRVIQGSNHGHRSCLVFPTMDDSPLSESEPLQTFVCWRRANGPILTGVGRAAQHVSGVCLRRGGRPLCNNRWILGTSRTIRCRFYHHAVALKQRTIAAAYSRLADTIAESISSRGPVVLRLRTAALFPNGLVQVFRAASHPHSAQEESCSDNSQHDTIGDY